MSDKWQPTMLERWGWEERDKARADLAVALVQRDRARALACRLEEELALIRRAAHARRHG